MILPPEKRALHGAAFLVVASMALTGCGGPSPERAKEIREARAKHAASKKKNRAIRKQFLSKAKVTTQSVNGVTLRVAARKDLGYALVGPRFGFAEVSASILERAATQATGCQASYQDGMARFTSKTKETVFKTPSSLRVELAC